MIKALRDVEKKRIPLTFSALNNKIFQVIMRGET